jgi:hypothetical protein
MTPIRRIASQSELQLHEVYADREHRMGHIGNVLVCFSRSEPSGQLLPRFTEAIRELNVRYSGGVAFLVVIDSDAGPPSERVREQIKKTLRDPGIRLAALAQVVEGRGFMAASKRSALALVALVARFPFPLKIFDTVSSGAEWILEKMGDGALDNLTVSQLMGATHQLRGTAGVPA